MKIRILFFLFTLINTHTASVWAADGFSLKPNKTYIYVSDIDLSKERVYGGRQEESDVGIPLHTTGYFDSHEGRGWLHLDLEGVFFEDKKVCGWDEKNKKLNGCPDDLPLIASRGDSNKITLYLLVNKIKKEENSKEMIEKGYSDEIIRFITSFRNQELFLDPSWLESAPKKNGETVWQKVETDKNGEVIK
jgi:hypothetical protein